MTWWEDAERARSYDPRRDYPPDDDRPDLYEQTLDREHWRELVRKAARDE